MDIAFYENLRETLVGSKSNDMYAEYLNDLAKFDQLDSGYEFLNANIAHIQRAIRNLDDAINGKEYARDAVFTALGYIQSNLKKHCDDIAESETVDAGELKELETI